MRRTSQLRTALTLVAVLLALTACVGPAVEDPGGDNDPVTGHQPRPSTSLSAEGAWLDAEGKVLTADSLLGVRRWDTGTGELTNVVPERSLRGTASPDASLLAVVETTGEGGRAAVVVRSSRDGREVHRLVGPEVARQTDHSDQPLRSPAFSPDSSHLAAVDHDGRVWVWDLASGEESGFDARGTTLTAVAWNPQGTRLAVSSAEEPVDIHEVDDGSVSGTLDGVPQRGVRWSADGSVLATVGHAEEDGSTVTVWDASSHEVADTLTVREGLANRIELSHDSSRLAVTVAGSPAVLVRELDTAETTTLRGAREPGWQVLWAPDDSRLYAVGLNSVTAWALGTEDGPLTFEAPPAP